MKNINRLATHITKHGEKNILIHTIPQTSNWIICQKIENNKWMLTLCNPMGNTTYNLGTIDDGQHIELWNQLIKLEIENKTSQILMAKELRDQIKNLINYYAKENKKSYKETNQNNKTNIKEEAKEIKTKIQNYKELKRTQDLPS